MGKGEGQPRPDTRWEPREGETPRGGKENRKCGWRVEENGGRRFKRLENDITLERELHVAGGQKGKSRANWAQDGGATRLPSGWWPSWRGRWRNRVKIGQLTQVESTGIVAGQGPVQVSSADPHLAAL